MSGLCGLFAPGFHIVFGRLAVGALISLGAPAALLAREVPLSASNLLSQEQYLPPECINYQVQTVTPAEAQRDDVAAKAKRAANMMSVEMAKVPRTRCALVKKEN